MSDQALLDAILSRSTGRGSRIHGHAHWAGVAAAGLTLLDQTPEADPLTVLLFSLFHDSMRQNDGHDPEHGKRGAALAREMRDAGEFELDDARLDTLVRACELHDKGQTSTDPTVGVCWDADRLNLWRVMRRPDPALLSTPAGRRVAGTNVPHIFSRAAFSWSAIFFEYAAKIDAAPGRHVYLRFGDLPADGLSAAPLIGIREHGVSVYSGFVEGGGSYVLDLRRPLLGTDTRFLAWLLSEGRPLYVVEGRQVGIGGMGEPVLEDARIVEEVPPRSVGVLPDRPRFRALVGAWRAIREGGYHDPRVWHGAKEPDERPIFPLVANGSMGGFWDAVEDAKREMLKGWGLLEDYERMQAESKARRRAEREKPEPDLAQSLYKIWTRPPDPVFSQSFDKAPWKESPWK